jgi:hypothetical protein
MDARIDQDTEKQRPCAGLIKQSEEGEVRTDIGVMFWNLGGELWFGATVPLLVTLSCQPRKSART